MPIPSAPARVRRALLRDDVYSSIREAIVRGDLTPGEKINDAELGAWLGVSRTPVREALLRLARDGLITATPGRVTAVAPEDPAALASSAQVAAELHALAVRLGAASLTDDDLALMRAANDRLRAAVNATDPEGALAADDDFHSVIVQRAGNAVLIEHLDAVTATLRRAEYLHFGSRRSSPDEHDRIVAALDAGDVERAAHETRANWLGLS